MVIDKIKILGAVLELPALPIQPIYLKIGPNWQCCLAGSSKTAPRILIFSIAMDADYLFYVISIATYAPPFLRYNNSVLARVSPYQSVSFRIFHNRSGDLHIIVVDKNY